MCRLCGRVVKCIFDSMPSRVPSVTSTRSVGTITCRQSLRSTTNHISSRSLSRTTTVADYRHLSKPQTSILPQRSKLHAAATQQAAPDTSFSADDASSLPPSMLSNIQQQPLTTYTPPTSLSTPKSQSSQSSKPLVLSKSLQQLLPSLTAQKPHYITAHIHRFPYLLQAGDTLRLPFHMSGVNAGDILRLNRASIIGSRDYTLKAGTNSTETYDTKRTGEPNYLDERLFEVRARVASVDSGPMFEMEKTKRRNRKVKTVKSKHKFTTLKIMEVKIKTLEELMEEKGSLVLET